MSCIKSWYDFIRDPAVILPAGDRGIQGSIPGDKSPDYITTTPRLPATKLIGSNVHSGAATLSASMMLLCCSLASSYFTLRKSSFLPDDRLNSRMYSVGWFLLITIPSSLWFKNGFHKTVSGRNHSVPFRAFLQRSYFNVCCLFRKQFSAAYMLKLFLLPQRVHTTLLIRCDKPELTRWCLCSLQAGIQMSPDEVVGSRDGCRNSIAESTVDVPIRLSGKFPVLAPRCSRALSHNLQLASDHYLIFASHSATGKILAIAIIFRLLCLQGRAGRSNPSLRTLCFYFVVPWSLPSTCHMQGDWYCLALPYLAHIISRIFLSSI